MNDKDPRSEEKGDRAAFAAKLHEELVQSTTRVHVLQVGTSKLWQFIGI